MNEEIGNAEEVKTSTPENDLSEIKIRHVLAQRIKKCGYKRIIGLILLAVVSFGGGILTDRLVLRHGAKKGFYGRAPIERNMPGKPGEKKDFKSGNGNKKQLPKSKNTPSQKQSQGSSTE